MSDARAAFLSDLYIRHNARRLEHLASLQLDLSGRSVLELGAGIGDHSVFYLDRGCTVTAVEPRADNVAVLRERMRQWPAVWDPGRLRVVEAPVERLGDIPGLPSHDIVHCYGLLYHLRDPRAVLAAAARRCDDLLLVETKVRLPGQPPTVVEDQANPTNAIDGAATLLTRAELITELRSWFPRVYAPRLPVAHEQFPEDWDHVPPDQWPIRAVLVAARTHQASPALAET